VHYATTLDKTIVYSQAQVASAIEPTNGGYFLPLQIPRLNLESIMGKSANDTVAHVINLFFSSRMTGRDVDLAIGKFPVRLFHMNHRISVIESWHNLDRDFVRMVKNLTAQILESKDTDRDYGVWHQIVIRAAVICGAYTIALNQQILHPSTSFDISVPSGDFSCALSAWLCREMGLPVKNIIVCTNENNNLWDFLNHGELRTGRTVISTNTPACDKSVADLIEILLSFYGSSEEVMRFRHCCAEGKTFFLSEEILNQIENIFYVSVISQSRMEVTISGAYSTHGYIFGPYSALTYAGALDYRAVTGENRHIMLLSEISAAHHDKLVAEALDISIGQLNNILDS